MKLKFREREVAKVATKSTKSANSSHSDPHSGDGNVAAPQYHRKSPKSRPGQEGPPFPDASQYCRSMRPDSVTRFTRFPPALEGGADPARFPGPNEAALPTVDGRHQQEGGKVI